MNYEEYREKISELQVIPAQNIIPLVLSHFDCMSVLPNSDKRKRYLALLNVLIDILNYSEFGEDMFDTFNYTGVRDECVKRLLEKKGELYDMDDLINRLYE